MTTHEAIDVLLNNIIEKCLIDKPAVEAAKMAIAALKTLDSKGYAYNGGELWAPPLGNPPNWDLIDKWRNRAEALERANREGCVCSTCLHGIGDVGEDRCLSCHYSESAWQFDEDRFSSDNKK
jgi:hypothetical protein